MLTDAPPRKANHAGFLESDRIRTLDLPQDGRLPSITEFVESARAEHRRPALRTANDSITA